MSTPSMSLASKKVIWCRCGRNRFMGAGTRKKLGRIAILAGTSLDPFIISIKCKSTYAVVHQTTHPLLATDRLGSYSAIM